MHIPHHLRPAALALLAGLITPAVAQPFPQAEGTRYLGPEDQPVTTPPTLVEYFSIDPALIPIITLDPVPVEDLLAEDELHRLENPNLPYRLGVTAPVDISPARDGAWFNAVDPDTGVLAGRLWVLDIQSPGSRGTSVVLDELALPAGARVQTWSPTEGPGFGAGPLSASRLTARVDCYGRVGLETGPGDTTRVALLIPTDASLQGAGPHFDELRQVEMPDGWIADIFSQPAAPEEAAPLRVCGVTQFYRDPASAAGDRSSLPCHEDATCHPAWDPVRDGTLLLVIPDKTQWPWQYNMLTGTLIANNSADYASLILTSDQIYYGAAGVNGPIGARDMEVLFNWQTATCNGAAPATSYSAHQLDANTGELLWKEQAVFAGEGAALVHLKGWIPFGAGANPYYLGWDAAPPATNTPVGVIHHSAGDPQYLSKAATRTYTPAGNTSDLPWNLGTAEAEAVGAAVLRESDQKIIGVLSRIGQAACSPSYVNEAHYFHFDRVYGGDTLTYLNGGALDDNLEPNDTPATATLESLRPWIPVGHVGLACKPGNPDWFRFTVGPGRRVVVIMVSDWEQAVARLAVQRAGGPLVYESTVGIGVCVLENTTPSPQEYRASMELLQGQYAEYTLAFWEQTSVDDCADAVPLPTDGTELTYAAAAALGATLYTTDGPITPGACDALHKDAWFRIAADCDGPVEVRFDHVFVNPAPPRIQVLPELAVYNDTGACPPSPSSLIACSNGAGGPDQRTLTFNALTGHDYLVRVGTDSNPDHVFLGHIAAVACGNQFKAIPTPPPVNDRCCNATPITQGTHALSTYGARTDGDAHPGTDCDDGGNTQIHADVWFEYVADCTGRLTVSVCDVNFDAKVAVYEMDTLSCPGSLAELSACNNDTPFPLTCPAHDAGAWLRMNVVAGRTYILRIGGHTANDIGDGFFSLTCSSRTPGDATGDGAIDFLDLNRVLSSWDDLVPFGEEGDVNFDGIVNFEDLNEVLTFWGG